MSKIEYPSRGPLTQGTVFSGALAENYDHCPVWGLVITARCDVANDKVKVWNYLPVVRFDDWLHVDGRTILAERVQADQTGKLKGLLKGAGHSASILETETVARIANALFPASDPKFKKIREKLDDISCRIQAVEAALCDSRAASHCLTLAEFEPKIKDALISDLLKHQLAGYYFLDRIESRADDLGYVVLLREVRHIPSGLAAAIAKGLDDAAYKALCASHPSAVGHLDMKNSDYAMPVGILDSPDAEHLMQTFSLLFARIGIADIPAAYLEKLWGRQPSVLKGSKP